LLIQLKKRYNETKEEADKKEIELAKMKVGGESVCDKFEKHEIEMLRKEEEILTSSVKSVTTVQQAQFVLNALSVSNNCKTNMI